MFKSSIDITRAWTDEDYRLSLSASERALLPANPAGPAELSDDDLAAVLGGTDGGTVNLPRTFSCTKSKRHSTCSCSCSADASEVDGGGGDLQVLA